MAYNLGYVDAGGYNLGYTGDFTGGPSISAADDVVEAQVATVTLANNVDAPTELRLGSTVVSFTFDAGVMTYTAPLLPNNPALVVEVDVDGVTISETIAYTNTYPYTHVPGNVHTDSVFPNTTFGPVPLVYIKIITDADPAIATVNWPGYAADNFESQWRDFVTVASEVAATTEVLIGFYIPETDVVDTMVRELAVDDAPEPAAPEFQVGFGTPIVTHNSITQPTSYSGSDATGFEYSTDGGSNWISYTSPIELTDLAAETGYPIQARATNSVGPGPIASTTVTTSAEPVLAPSGTITFGSPTITGDTITQPYSYSASDQSGFEHRIDGGQIIAGSSPVVVESLAYEQSVLIEVRAINSAGETGWFSVTRTTEAEPLPPVVGISGITRPSGAANTISKSEQFTVDVTIPDLLPGYAVRAYIDHLGDRYWMTVLSVSSESNQVVCQPNPNLPLVATEGDAKLVVEIVDLSVSQ